VSGERSEVGQLYDVASDSETVVLDQLRKRAGQVWECDHCRCLNVRALHDCEGCGRPRERPTVRISRAQLEAWAGPLTDEQVELLDECIPNSSIPDAVATIVGEALGIRNGDLEGETF
jgi:hypothetical protein